MKRWPPKPGLTLITSTRSISGSSQSMIESGVPGLSDRPAFLPSDLMSWTVRCGCAPASGWKVMMSAPAWANSATKGSTGAIIRCTSNGSLAWRAQRLHHHGADGEVRDEMPVHHIHMDIIRPSRRDRAHFRAQLGEIGAEDRGGDAGLLLHGGCLPFAGELGARNR